MALQYGTKNENKTIETWERARTNSENQPIQFPGRRNCFSKAYKNLQHLSNNRTVHSKSKDLWEQTPRVQGFHA
jgi:hypothetical protein